MRRIILITLVAVVSAGCATTAGYEKILNSWVGSSESNLISSWGPPQSTYVLDDGGKVLSYDNKRNIQIGGYATITPITTYNNGTINGDLNANFNSTSTTYVPTRTPVQSISMVCITRFAVRNGVVQTWAWQGNDCRAIAPDSPGQSKNSYVNTEEFQDNNIAICKRHNEDPDEIQRCLKRLSVGVH